MTDIQYIREKQWGLPPTEQVFAFFDVPDSPQVFYLVTCLKVYNARRINPRSLERLSQCQDTGFAPNCPQSNLRHPEHSIEKLTTSLLSEKGLGFLGGSGFRFRELSLECVRHLGISIPVQQSLRTTSGTGNSNIQAQRSQVPNYYHRYTARANGRLWGTRTIRLFSYDVA